MSTQIITLIGALGGALFGFLGGLFTNILSNRQAVRLARLKNNLEQAITEKERNRTLLEELCSLCYQIDREIAQTFKVVEKPEDRPPLPITLSESVNRMTVIVNLYFRSLKEPLDNYVASLHSLQDAFYIIYTIAQRTSSPAAASKEWNEYQQLTAAFKKNVVVFSTAIAELSQNTPKPMDAKCIN
jgi:hypothetical protein